tara:strand:+ start:203 stop:889 length:687 start_codon:yes stop_codon:yes gene_type:complete
MTTALEIIADALDEIQVSEAEAPIEDYDAQLARRKLNQLMTQLPLNTGYTPVSLVDDTLTVRADVEGYMVKHLAMALAPSYSRPVPAQLTNDARQSRAELYRRYVAINPMAYPSTLPIGTGTASPGEFDDDQYPGGFDREITEASANYTLLLTDDIVEVDCTNGPVTITLMAASSANGYGFGIRKVDQTANMVIVDPAGSDLFRGEDGVRFNLYDSLLEFSSDGSNWV